MLFLLKIEKFNVKLLKKKNSIWLSLPIRNSSINAFKKKYGNKSFKNAEILAKNSISLPIDPNLSKKELKNDC